MYFLATILKSEHEHVYNWCKYYLNLGVDKIIIYDNNNLNSESYTNQLKDFIIDKKVELRYDLRGKFPPVDFSQKALANELYHDFGSGHYYSFFDCDEYLDIKPYNSMQEMFDSLDFEWDILQFQMITYYPEKPVIFQRDWNENDLIMQNKAIDVKYVAKTGHTNFHFNQHSCDLQDQSNIAIKYTDGTRCFRNPVDLNSIYKVDIKPIHIKHYRIRSLEDFVKNKILRGDIVRLEGVPWEYYFNYYKDSSNYLKQILKNNLSTFNLDKDKHIYRKTCLFLNIPINNFNIKDNHVVKTNKVAIKNKIVNIWKKQSTVKYKIKKI